MKNDTLAKHFDILDGLLLKRIEILRIKEARCLNGFNNTLWDILRDRQETFLLELDVKKTVYWKDLLDFQTLWYKILLLKMTCKSTTFTLSFEEENSSAI